MSHALSQFSRNVTSEHGEDGIVERVFSLIGEGGRWCVELGALNGRHGSNVWNLVKNHGWRGVLIEADPTYFEMVCKEYRGTGSFCVNRFVSFDGPNALDVILAGTPLPERFDLLSLDIDGNDYHVWDTLVRYAPRVAIVEFNPSIPNEVSFIQPRDMRVQQGSSLRAIVELGKKKGYELVAVTDTNAIFVLRELYSKLGVGNNSLDVFRPHNPFETKLFQLYDGTLKLAGYTELIWRKLPIDEEKLQVLPQWRRVYPAGVSANGFVRRLKYWVRQMPFYALLQRVRKAL